MLRVIFYIIVVSLLLLVHHDLRKCPDNDANSKDEYSSSLYGDFKEEVYTNHEFFFDCIEFRMEECFKNDEK